VSVVSSGGGNTVSIAAASTGSTADSAGVLKLSF
jgi:hypothetical protein